MTSQQSTHQIAERLQSYSTESLKDAVVNLYKMDGEEALIAYQIGFEELNRRMGDEAFDAWLDSKNI